MPSEPRRERPLIKKVKTSMALPEELWRAVRIRAIQQGVDAQDLVARALEAYLKGDHK